MNISEEVNKINGVLPDTFDIKTEVTNTADTPRNLKDDFVNVDRKFSCEVKGMEMSRVSINMDSINMMKNMKSLRNNEHIKCHQIELSNNIDDKVVLSNNETDKNLHDKDNNSSMNKKNIFLNQNLIIKLPANKIDPESKKYNGPISSGFTSQNQQDNNIQNINNSNVYAQNISSVTPLHNNQDHIVIRMKIGNHQIK